VIPNGGSGIPIENQSHLVALFFYLITFAQASLAQQSNKKTQQAGFSMGSGGGGIRTRGTGFPVRQFSKLLVSASHPPLLWEGKFKDCFPLSTNFFDLY